MPARYVNISLEEFEEFMTELEFERTLVTGNEYVYERTFKRVDAKVRVYSSIASTSGQARKKGGDAIRVVVLYLNENQWRPTGKNRRVHRVANWRENLKTRIEEVRTDVHPDPCPRCKAPMLLRDGVHGPFYSCCAWFATKCEGKASTNSV